MVTAVIIIALLVCLAGALYISKGIRLTEYTSNRSRTGLFHVVFTLLGTLVGGWMFFGLSAIGYEAGIVGYFIGLGYAIGLVILALFSKKIKQAADEHHCDTIDDFIRARFGRSAQIITAVINMIIFLTILAAQFVAMAAFLMVFTDLQSQVAFYLAAFIVIVYTAASGYKGVLLTDFWQFIVLGISAVSIFILLTMNRDPNAIQALDPKYFNGMGYGAIFLIGAVVLFPPTLLCRSDMWQRISSAKDYKVARNAFWITAPALLICYILLTTIGLYARAGLGPDQRPDISGFIYFLNILHTSGFSKWVSQIFLSIMALGVFAALLSTADSYINIVAVSISKVVRREKWSEFEATSEINPDASGNEHDLLRMTRWLAIVFGVLSIVLAKTIPDIVNLIVAAASVLMILMPVILVALFSKIEKRRTTQAVASLIAGLVVFTYCFFNLSNPKVAFLPGVLVAGIAYMVVAAFSRKYSNI